MDVDREYLRQIAFSLAAVVLFFVGLLAIGSAENTTNGLTPDGAIAVVGAITGFIIIMAAIGLFLAKK